MIFYNNNKRYFQKNIFSLPDTRVYLFGLIICCLDTRGDWRLLEIGVKTFPDGLIFAEEIGPFVSFALSPALLERAKHDELLALRQEVVSLPLKLVFDELQVDKVVAGKAVPELLIPELNLKQ